VRLGLIWEKSTCAFARMLPEDGKITTIDTFKGSEEHFVQLKLYNQLNNLYMNTSINLRLDEHAYKIKMVNKGSLDFYTDEKFDLIYLDASHAEEDVIKDIKHYVKFIKLGGFLTGDDMLWPSVKNAVNRCISDNSIPSLSGVFRDVIWWIKI
jgi:predicted O-methyltransferase YrrM